MKKEEQSIIKLFDPNKALTSKQIKESTNIKDPSSTLRDLVYFGYLEKNKKDEFVRTSKIYKEANRKEENKSKKKRRKPWHSFK